MVRETKRTPLVVMALLMMLGMATAQTQHEKESLSIQGCAREATVMRWQGHVFVDVEDLARITNASVRFEKERIVLTPPRCDASNTAGDVAKPGFSRPFVRAAIEAMASIREWGGTLMITVQNGYPVGNTMAGNTIMAFQGRAADNVALAASAASTESDYRGLELLKGEFNNVEIWSDNFVKARSSMSAAKLTTSENGLKDDQDVQKMIRCGQFLAQMFAGGTFQDDAACR